MRRIPKTLTPRLVQELNGICLCYIRSGKCSDRDECLGIGWCDAVWETRLSGSDAPDLAREARS